MRAAERLSPEPGVRGGSGRVLLFLVLLAWGPVTGVRAQVEEEEAAAWLEYWTQQPLDLRAATEEELALLPPLGPEGARALRVLRDLGGLDDRRRVERELGVPLEALRPWLRFSEGDAPEGDLRVDSDREGRGRLRARVPAGPRGRVVVGASWPAGRLRGAWSAERGGWSLGAGILREQGGSGLDLEDPRRRGWTGLAARPRDLRFLPRTDTDSWAGGEAMFVAHARSGRRWFVGGMRDANGRIHPRAQWRRGGPGGRWALSWRGGERPRAVAEFEGVRTAVRHWVAVVRGRRASAGAASLRAQRAQWSLGLDLVHSDLADGVGLDPLSGARLDRPHRAWQLQAQWRGRGTAMRLFVRERHRGRLGDEETDRRLRLRAWARLPTLRPTRVEVEIGWDTRPGLTEPMVQGVLRRGSRREWTRWSWRRRGEGALASDRFSATASMPWNRYRVRLDLAAVSGARARPWVRGAAGQSRLRWIEPGGVGGAVSIEGGAAASRFGLWLEWVVAPGSPPRPAFGLHWQGKGGGR